MSNRSKIELRIAKLREEMLALSMGDNLMSQNEGHLLHTVEQALPGLRNHLKKVYLDNNVEEAEARQFHLMLKDTLDEAFRIARLNEVIDRDEQDLLNHVHNTFVHLTRLIKEDIS